MPEPSGLVVKNGTNRFGVAGKPGPSSSTQISTWRAAARRRQPTLTPPPVSSAASAALRTRLMSSCSSWSPSARMRSSGPGFDPHGQARLEARDAAHQRADVDTLPAAARGSRASRA